MVNNEVYTRNDLNNLYLENLAAVKETHIRCAAALIKRRVLAAAAEGNVQIMFRRFGNMLEGHHALHCLKNNGLLENDAIAHECVPQVVERLCTIFPDSHINQAEDHIYICWPVE